MDVVEELDKSGGDSARPLWNAAVERIERGEAGALVVWNLSRFARSILDAKRMIDRIEATGGRLVTEEGAEGMSRDILLVVAEHERLRHADALPGRRLGDRAPHPLRQSRAGRLHAGSQNATVGAGRARPGRARAVRAEGEGRGLGQVRQWSWRAGLADDERPGRPVDHPEPRLPGRGAEWRAREPEGPSADHHPAAVRPG